jgi:hypothetical protein
MSFLSLGQAEYLRGLLAKRNTRLVLSPVVPRYRHGHGSASYLRRNAGDSFPRPPCCIPLAREAGCILGRICPGRAHAHKLVANCSGNGFFVISIRRAKRARTSVCGPVSLCPAGTEAGGCSIKKPLPPSAAWRAPPGRGSSSRLPPAIGRGSSSGSTVG